MEFEMIKKVAPLSTKSLIEALIPRCEEQLKAKDNVLCQIVLSLSNGTAVRGFPVKICEVSRQFFIYFYQPKTDSSSLDFSIIPLDTVCHVQILNAQMAMKALTQGEVAFDSPPPMLSPLEAKRKLSTIETAVPVVVHWESLGESLEARVNVIQFVESLSVSLRSLGKDALGQKCLAALKKIEIKKGPEEFKSLNSELLIQFPFEKALPGQLAQKIENEISKQL